jgi:SAM-dependent methyltransferase
MATLVMSAWRRLALSIGYLLNETGVRLIVAGREMVRHVDRSLVDEHSDRFVLGLPKLHRAVAGQIRSQRKEYRHYAYFQGFPYQSLGILGIYGERGTEERFDAYGLAGLLGPDDRVLDVGCNCGFMAVYSVFRTGGRADGIDINPYMIEIGRACAEYLNIGDRVRLHAGRFQDFQPTEKYTAVFSFATHWTDDRNYRVSLGEHLTRLHALLEDDGLLVFESHSADVGSEEFYAALEAARNLFSWNGRRLLENGSRELYIMKKN